MAENVGSLVGQDLVDLVSDRLGGYQNAVDPKVALDFINDGKDEVWSVLKSLEAGYATQISQATDSTQSNYFAALSVNSRQFTLPDDFQEMRFIEVTAPSGFEQTQFVYKRVIDPIFQEARRTANVDRTLFPFTTYYYDIIGKDQFLMAQFPEQPFTLTLYYVRYIPDVSISTVLSDIMLPYSKKIADFAAKKITLSLQDQPMSDEYRQEWKSDIITISNDAGLRNTADPTFVIDFIG